MCYDPGCSGTGHQVWGYAAALGAGVHDVFLAWAAGVDSMSTHVVFGQHCVGNTVAVRAVGILAVPPGPAASARGRRCWWLEPLVCTYLVMEPAECT